MSALEGATGRLSTFSVEDRCQIRLEDIVHGVHSNQLDGVLALLSFQPSPL